MSKRNPFLLVIIDGFGVAPYCDSNGVSLAKHPNFDKYIKNFPVFSLMAAGEAVGLSWGEIGNSEVGHINLGAGKIPYQNLPRIDKSIDDGEFFENEVLVAAMEHVKSNKSSLHIMGLMSDGKVHAFYEHAFAAMELAKKQKVKNVFLHCFLDGRDSIYNSALEYIKAVQSAAKRIGVGEVATVSGRYYAMDRDNHWERIEKVYNAMVKGTSDETFNDPLKAIASSYEKKVYDEEFVPVVITKGKEPVGLVKDNDAIIFINYRADRARQITRAFVIDEFDKFERQKISNLFFVTMTEYEKELPVKVAFEKDIIKTSLSKIISDNSFNQYHIAETEKYAHVTFFFNGGVEAAFPGEDRDVIPSPRVASYAEKPEMSADLVNKKLAKVIMQEKHDFYVVNYANTDMVAHTGDIPATIKAIETVDRCIGEVVDLILSKGGQCMIVSDHGNCEELRNLQTGEISKDHSTNPVPCMIIGENFRGQTNPDSQLVGNDLSLLTPVGLLADVPATVLKLMQIEVPPDMSGRPLI